MPVAKSPDFADVFRRLQGTTVLTTLHLIVTPLFFAGPCPHCYMSDQFLPVLNLLLMDEQDIFFSKKVTVEGRLITVW